MTSSTLTYLHPSPISFPQWGIIFDGTVKYDELEQACVEAYRRALHADPSRFPDPLAAPLQVEEDSRGRWLPVAYPPGAPPPPTPLWQDALGGESGKAGSDSNQPLASVRQTLPARARAAFLRYGPMALDELVRSAKRGQSLGEGIPAAKGRTATPGVIRVRL